MVTCPGCGGGLSYDLAAQRGIHQCRCSPQETYDPTEQDEIIAEFVKMLRSVTADGGRKRAAGLKPSWKVDDSHVPAMYRHLHRWDVGEQRDKDSGAHPLVHAAWRCLAIAYIESRP